jgi:hypothetical protein
LGLPNPPNPCLDECHFEDQCGRMWSTKMLNIVSKFWNRILMELS